MSGEEWPIEHSTRSGLIANLCEKAYSNQGLAASLFRNDFSTTPLGGVGKAVCSDCWAVLITRAIVYLSGISGVQRLFRTSLPCDGMSPAHVLRFGG